MRVSFSSTVKRAAKAGLRRYRPETLYPYPNSSLQPERLYLYLDTLWRMREVEGAVVEVGCWLGGTAAVAAKMLRRTGHPKRYVCVDTFSGFLADQFDHDQRRGVPAADREIYDASSLPMVRRLLARYGTSEVELVEGDIVTLPDELLPDAVAVCLIDVDLEIPVYEGLSRIVPRLSEGGCILVDDCPEQTTWVGARAGYRRFVAEADLPERYEFGMGVIANP